MYNEASIKNLFKVFIIGAIGIAVAILGLKQYQGYKKNILLQASVVYEAALGAKRENQFDILKQKVSILKDLYSKTPYYPLATLLIAKEYVEQGEIDAAKNVLLPLTTAKSPFRHYAVVRLARLYGSLGQYKEGLQVLDSVDNKGFETLYLAAKADLYMLQQDFNNAHKYYAEAIREAPLGLPLDLLQLKQNDLF